MAPSEPVHRSTTRWQPAASAVYELTERGRELEAPAVALARWGGGSLGARSPEQRVSADSVMLALRAAFAGAAERGVVGTYEARFAETGFAAVFGVRVGDAGVEVSGGPAVGVDAVVLTDVETLYAVANGREAWRGAVERGGVRIDGDPAGVARLLDGLGGHTG